MGPISAEILLLEGRNQIKNGKFQKHNLKINLLEFTTRIYSLD